jgi:hypothetical protein
MHFSFTNYIRLMTKPEIKKMTANILTVTCIFYKNSIFYFNPFVIAFGIIPYTI